MKSYTDCAVVYVATGARFVEEACRAAVSCKAQMPEIKTVLHTDLDFKGDPFDQIKRVENPLHREIDKVVCYRNVAEQRLLFLDTDTYVAGPLYDCFDLLSRFDLVACHAPWRLSWDLQTRERWQIEGVPNAFCELNTGVIGFRNRPAVQEVFKRWKRLHGDNEQHGAVMHDQPAFRQAVWESDLAVYIMPPEYNCRTEFPAHVNGNAKVVHGRGIDPQDLARRLESEPGHKLFNPYDQGIYTDQVLQALAPQSLKQSVRRFRFRHLGKLTLESLVRKDDR